MTPDSRAVASLATTAVVVGATLVLVAVLSTPAAAADGNTTLEVSEPFPLVESTHTWQTDVGESEQESPALTEVELDYGSLDLSLGGVSAEDVSVTVGGESVPVESVDSGLLTAGLTVALADAVNASEGESVVVTVDSMQNPILGEHSAEIRLAGTDVVYTAATALFEILEPDPASFDVTMSESDSVLDVTAGEQVSVSASIENRGDVAGTQTVELLVNGTVRQTRSVTLDAGSLLQEEFRFDASPEDDGATVAVRSANETAAAETTLIVDSQQAESPSFEVSFDEGDQQVVAGNDLTVTYTVENTGTAVGTQDISLLVNGTSVASDPAVQLDPGENRTDTFSYPVDSSALPAVTVTVATRNQSVQRTVDVLEPPQFNVTLRESQSTLNVTAGQPIELAVTIENRGEVTSSQTVDLGIGSLGSDSVSVQLAGGASTQRTFSVGTETGEAGSYTATIASANDSLSRDVTVDPVTQPDPANFSVRIDSTNAPVLAGNPLTVNVTVQNTGNASGTQTVGLTLGDVSNDDSELTLAAGASTTATLTVGTNDPGPGEYTAAVFSENDTASESVEIRAFDVAIQSTNTPIPAGENLTVTVGISNNVTGTNTVETTVEQTVELDAGQLGTDTVLVEAEGPGPKINRTETFSLETEPGDAGSYTVTVAAEGTVDSSSVTVNPAVQPAANFSVDIDATNAPVEAGEDLTVTATIENTGDLQATQTVSVAAEGLGTDSAWVTLSANASTTETFTFETEDGDAGEYTAVVTSADDSASQNVTVTPDEPAPDPANFSVTVDSTNVPVEGEMLLVNATVENTGDLQATQTVELTVESLGTDSASVTLAGGASTTATLAVETESGDAGEYTATVSAGQTATSTSATVNAPATFQLSNLRPAETTVPLGSGVNLSVTLQNTGDVAGTETLALTVGGLTETRTETVEAGATTTVTFSTVSTDSLGPGQYTPTVASATDSVSGTLAVEQPDSASFAVRILDGESTLAAPAGGQFEVVATVENIGDLAASQTVELLVGGQQRDEQTVELAAGARTTVALSAETRAGDDGATISLQSDDDTASAVATVQTPATFAVSLADLPDTVTAGTELTVGYEVTNTGDMTGTGQMTFRVDGNAVENTTQTVAGGQSVAGEFTYTPAEPSTALDVTVASDDDAANATLTVEQQASQPVLPDNIGFGAQVVGTNTSSEIGLTNSGAVPRTFSAIEIRGSDAFAVEEVPAEIEIGPGDLLRMTVRYAPETAGNDSGTLVLVDTDGTVAERVNLSGTALPAEPALQVAPGTVQFPEATVNETVTANVTVENVGTAPLTVRRVALDDSEAFALVDGGITDSEVIEPGTSREVTVSFTPAAERSYTGYLFVESDAPTEPDRTITLTNGDITARVESNASTQTLTVSANASAGERVEISFPGGPDDQPYHTDSVAVTPAVDGDLRLNVTTSNETLAAVRETTDGTTAGFADNTTRLGNISASTNIDNEAIEQAEFTATINRSRFETRNTNASDISFYRFDETAREWVKQNTTVVNRTETTVTVRVVGDGFSEWTAAAARPEFSIDNTEVNVRTATVGEEVEIEVFVTNTGGTEGTYVAELLLNGEVVEDQTAIIASEGQENFLFQRSINDPGQYEVQVNEVFVATVNITESGAEVEQDPPGNETDDGESDDMLLLAVPAVVVILAVVGLGVFYSRRREEDAGTAEDARWAGGDEHATADSTDTEEDVDGGESEDTERDAGDDGSEETEGDAGDDGSTDGR